jgi:hypothetical protein
MGIRSRSSVIKDGIENSIDQPRSNETMKLKLTPYIESFQKRLINQNQFGRTSSEKSKEKEIKNKESKPS